MKYKNIIAFFCVALPVSVAVRTLQLLYTTEAETGFFKAEYKTISFEMLLVVVAACAVMAVLAFNAHRSPPKPPKINPLIGLASLFLSCSVAYEVYSEKFVSTVPMWQILALQLLGFITALFFIVFALRAFLKFEIPGLLFVIPALYWILRIICIFTTISSLALITENVFVLAACCASLLFLVNLAKLYNAIDTELNFRKLLASGLVSIILCAAVAIPRYIAAAIGRAGNLHSSVCSTLTMLAFGCFAAAFIFSYFSRSNLDSKHRHHRHHHRHHAGGTVVLPDNGANNSFYINPSSPKKKPF